MLDPDADPYEGLDLSSSEEEKNKMADINNINDEEVLHKMMNKTDNFEERKRIRTRLRELREAESAKFAAAKEARDASRESAVELRQRQAAAEKERKMRDFQETAKEGKKDSGIMEQELRRKHAEAAAAKEAELEKMKELGKAMSAAHHAGAEIISKADEKGRAVLEGKE